jgi:hypothetical protein
MKRSTFATLPVRVEPAEVKLAETAHYVASAAANRTGNEDNYQATLSLFLAVFRSMGK